MSEAAPPAEPEVVFAEPWQAQAFALALQLHEQRAFTWTEWAAALSERLKAAGMAFVIEPNVRFKGEAGEQSTMFFLDPSGNALEFKAFADDAMVFAT